MPYSRRVQPAVIADLIAHLGLEVVAARRKVSRSQAWLSERAEVSQSTWSMVENGLAEGIRLETLAEIATALGCEMSLAPCDHIGSDREEPRRGHEESPDGDRPATSTGWGRPRQSA